MSLNHTRRCDLLDYHNNLWDYQLVAKEGRMRIKITGREQGSIPSEAVVTIPTSRGPEEVVVHSSQATDDSVEAGFIGEKGDQVLVELPRETLSGRWQVWIPKTAVAAA